MATRENWTYLEDGTIIKEIFEVPDNTPNLEQQIQEKEEQLLSMYKELERLKSLKKY